MNKNNVKQVIVFRKDLLKGNKAIRKGKFAAQCAHASTSAVLSLFNTEDIYSLNDELMRILTNEKPIGKVFSLNSFENTPFYQWINGYYTKICLSVENEEELIELYSKIKENNPQIPCVLIEDAGLTEFNGVPTKTCIGIGPYWSDEIDVFTKKLKLL